VKGKYKFDESNNHYKKFGKFKKGKHNTKNRKNRPEEQIKEKGKAFK
jgi:hypothetical protein